MRVVVRSFVSSLASPGLALLWAGCSIHCGGRGDPCHNAVYSPGLLIETRDAGVVIESIAGAGACDAPAVCPGPERFVPGCSTYQLRPVSVGRCSLVVRLQDGRSFTYEREIVDVAAGVCHSTPDLTTGDAASGTLVVPPEGA
jgi:hypothetical protein